MKSVAAAVSTFLLTTAVPAFAQGPDIKGDGARLDAAVVAGHAKVLAMNGAWTPARTMTVGCTTHVKWGAEDMPIDWKDVTLSDEGRALVPDGEHGPDAGFRPALRQPRRIANGADARRPSHNRLSELSRAVGRGIGLTAAPARE